MRRRKREPSAKEREALAAVYPKLRDAEFFITGAKDTSYNCVGFVLAAMRRPMRFQAPVESALAFQAAIANKHDLHHNERLCWDLFMEHHGLVRSLEPTPDDPVIAVYEALHPGPQYRGQGLVPDHVALRINAKDDWWESKLGEKERVLHRLRDLDSTATGTFAAYYVFKHEGWYPEPG